MKEKSWNEVSSYNSSSKESIIKEDTKSQNELTKSQPLRRRNSTRDSLYILGFLLFSLFLSEFMLKVCKYNLQNPPDNLRNAPPFITENAMQHIRAIGDTPKYVGSKSLEKSLRYVQEQLEPLREVAKQNDMVLDVDFFESSSNSHFIGLGILDIRTSYDKILSVVARLRPSNIPYDSSINALLINSHVDSALGTSGAGDDICAVGISLEVIRAFASMSSTINSLQRPIVFLFNGAEETILQGAHSFIIQHPWASNIAAFINLESLGSGDSYHLFRVESGNPWLMHAYMDSVSRPVGSVTSSDIFAIGLIPAETDFRIFTEDGKIPGYDFALVDNGYIYHTIYDDVAHVDPIGVQHGGNLVHELALELAGKNDAIGRHENGVRYISALSKMTNDLLGLLHSKGINLSSFSGRVTFFSIANCYIFLYDGNVALLLNIFVLTLTILLWTGKLQSYSTEDVLNSFKMIAVLLGTAVAMLASSSFAALIYSEVLNLKLQWYGNETFARLMFEMPAFFGVVTALLHLLPKNLTSRRYEYMLLAVSVVYFGFTAFLTRMGMMMSYAFCFVLIMQNIFLVLGDSVKPEWKHVGMIILTTVTGASQVNMTLKSILPLLGRVQSHVIPHDMFAALLVATLSMLLHVLPNIPLFCHFALGLRKAQRFLFVMCLLAAMYVSIIIPSTSREQPFTPYSTNAPKRVIAVHFHSPQLDPPSVLYLATLDPIPINEEEAFFYMNSTDKSISKLDSVPLWGKLKGSPLETLKPMQVFSQEEYVYPIDVPPTLDLPSVTVISEEETDCCYNLTIRAAVKDVNGISLRFHIKENSIVDSSFNFELKDDKTGGMWMKHNGSEELLFWIIVSKEVGKPRKKILMAASCLRLGTARSQTGLRKLNFGKSTAPVFGVSTGYEFEL